MKFIISLFFVIILTGCATKNLAPDLNLSLLTAENEDDFLNNEHIKAFNSKVDKVEFSISSNLNTVKRRLDSCHNLIKMEKDYDDIAPMTILDSYKNPVKLIEFENIKYVAVAEGLFGTRLIYGYQLQSSNEITNVTLYSRYNKTNFLSSSGLTRRIPLGKMTKEQLTNWGEGRPDATLFKTSCSPR